MWTTKCRLDHMGISSENLQGRGYLSHKGAEEKTILKQILKI